MDRFGRAVATPDILFLDHVTIDGDFDEPKSIRVIGCRIIGVVEVVSGMRLDGVALHCLMTLLTLVTRLISMSSMTHTQATR